LWFVKNQPFCEFNEIDETVLEGKRIAIYTQFGGGGGSLSKQDYAAAAKETSYSEKKRCDVNLASHVDH
jgi:hypothetical protein